MNIKEEQLKRSESLWTYAVDRFHQYDTVGDYEKAQEIALEMFDVAPERQGAILYYLGLTWWRNGEINLAKRLFLTAIELMSASDPMLIKAYNELSLLYQARGAWIGPHGSLIGWAGILEKRKRMVMNEDLREALGWSINSLGLWDNYLDPQIKRTPQGQNLLTHILDVEGLAYTAAGQFDRARNNHLQIIQEGTQTGDQSAVNCVRNNLGLSYYFEARQNRKDQKKQTELLAEAEKCFRQCLEEDSNKESVGYAIVLSNLARVLEAQGKDIDAFSLYEKCVEIVQKTNQDILVEDAHQHMYEIIIA